MKLQTKLQKLTESEKDTQRRRAEISRDVLEIIEQNKIQIKRLCADVDLSRAQFYYCKKNLCFSTETLQKIINLEVFQVIERERNKRQ